MSAAQNQFDVIVIGAGVEGSSSAYSLAKGGQRTLLLEQVLPTLRAESVYDLRKRLLICRKGAGE